MLPPVTVGIILTFKMGDWWVGKWASERRNIHINERGDRGGRHCQLGAHTANYQQTNDPGIIISSMV